MILIQIDWQYFPWSNINSNNKIVEQTFTTTVIKIISSKENLEHSSRQDTFTKWYKYITATTRSSKK